MDTARNHILAYLKSQSVELPDAALEEALLGAITLQEPMDFSGLGYKWIGLRRKADGSVEAMSLKPYNMLQIGQRELRRKLLSLGAQSALLSTVSGLLAVVASLVLLLLEFEEAMAHSYTEEQAKVLLAIYFTDGRFTEEEARQSYRRCHGQDIAPGALQESLAFLERLRAICKSGNGAWELSETITFRRDG